MVGGVDATAGLQKTSLGQKRQKTFFEGKTLAPRGEGFVSLDKADVVIDGYHCFPGIHALVRKDAGGARARVVGGRRSYDPGRDGAEAEDGLARRAAYPRSAAHGSVSADLDSLGGGAGRAATVAASV